MSEFLLSYGKCCDVRAIISVHLQNQVPGVETRMLQKRTTALCGFFVCGVSLHLSMVGWARQLSGWPGFFCDRFSTLVQFTTRIVESAVVNTSITEGIRS